MSETVSVCPLKTQSLLLYLHLLAGCQHDETWLNKMKCCDVLMPVFVRHFVCLSKKIIKTKGTNCSTVITNLKGT